MVTLMGGLMLVVTEEARLHLGPAFSLVTSLFLFLPPSLVSFIFPSYFSFFLPIWCICCLLFGCILSYFQFIVQEKMINDIFSKYNFFRLIFSLFFFYSSHQDWKKATTGSENRRLGWIREPQYF